MNVPYCIVKGKDSTWAVVVRRQDGTIGLGFGTHMVKPRIRLTPELTHIPGDVTNPGLPAKTRIIGGPTIWGVSHNHKKGRRDHMHICGLLKRDINRGGTHEQN